MNTMHRTLLTAGLATFGLGLGLLTAPACGGDTCTKLYNKALECATPEEKPLLEGLKEMAMKQCREGKKMDAEEEKAQLDCAAKATCDDYRKCQTEMREKARAREIKAEVEAALKTGEKVDEARMTCEFGDIKDEEVKKLCTELIKKSLDSLTKELVGLRDAGEDGFGKCMDLTMKAEKVSPEEKAKAEALCKEVQASPNVKKALAEVKKNIDGGTHQVPFECTWSIDELGGMKDSEWAKTSLQQVKTACYVDLGKKILAAKVDAMSYCEYDVEQLLMAIKKHDIKEPELDGWVTKAQGKCKA